MFRSRVSAWLVVMCLFGMQPARAEPVQENKEGSDVFLGQVKPVLYVADVEKSQAFYAEVLGFEFMAWAGEAGDPYYAEMRAGPLRFGLHEPRKPAERSRVGKQRLYFRVSDARAHRERVIARGGEAGEIEETDWMTMFSVVDRDGHEITFAETDPKRHKIDPW